MTQKNIKEKEEKKEVISTTEKRKLESRIDGLFLKFK